MKHFNHKILFSILHHKFPELSMVDHGQGTSEHFIDSKQVGSIEISNATKRHLYTIHLSFTDREDILDEIIKQYTEQKERISHFKQGLNVIIEDRMRNVSTLI